jgi:Heparinase II/III-like protein/Heparinase II/III N-terminus
VPRLEINERLKRLTTMSPRELAHRTREKVYSQLERIGFAGRIAPVGPGFKQYLADAPARRFYCGVGQSPRDLFPGWIDRAVEEAENLMGHEVHLLHFDPVRLGREIDWHRDPVTGQTWERCHWTVYRPENDPLKRDSKIVHELNRHQHLPRLAKAYRMTGDERYAAEALAQMLGWIRQNPPGLGINWQSSLEIGIRTISWLWTIFLLLPSRSFDDASAQLVGDSLFAQLEHVYRHTSLYSSPNTHLIGEAAALFIGGLVFQDRQRAVAWMGRGLALLVEEADKQILDDGAHGELSTYYHCYALDFYLQALVLAEQNDFRFPAGVRRKIREMLNFVMHVSTPGGTIPLFGDDDGGRALALAQRNYRSFTDALALGAVLFERSDFKHQAGDFPEETFWLLGPKAWETFDALESEPPVENQAIFASAGYAMQRSGWGPLDSQLLFDTGGLGMLTGGHSHADALSLVLYGHGRELLADPGTSVYNGAPEWRSYFRSTRAHNTVAIDDCDQAEAGGTFRWKTRMSTRMNCDASFPPEYLEAEHDGYQRLTHPVSHRRRLLHIPGEYWVVVDDFDGAGQHTFDFHYHFGAGVDATLDRPRETDLVTWAEKAGLFLSIHSSRPIAAELLTGWVSRGYGHRRPTRTLRASLTASAKNAAAITFISPTFTLPVVERLHVDTGSAIACAYHSGPFKDLVVFNTGSSEVQVAGFRMQGEFFWLRMEGSVLRKAVAIRGRVDCGTEVWEDALCAPFAAS